MLPNALKSCPKSNKSPNLVTLFVRNPSPKNGRQFLNRLAVVVAQLVEWLLLALGVHSSNSVIGKNLYLMSTVNCIEKTKVKEKRLGLAHFIKLLTRIDLIE